MRRIAMERKISSRTYSPVSRLTLTVRWMLVETSQVQGKHLLDAQ
jgi:hypothetical protein